MMLQKISGHVRKIGGTFAVAAGVLAITNLDNVWQGYRSVEIKQVIENPRALPSKEPKKTALASAIPKENYKPLQSALSQSLEQDELKDENPFAHLSNLDPLRQLMKKGVVKFRRDTYRSPDYQEESGYDILSYEIEHTDGSKSTILAYLEKRDASVWRNVGAPDARVPFVVFLLGNGEKTSYSSFRSGDLIEQAELSNSDAQNLVSHRLSQGVPFLSVSR